MVLIRALLILAVTGCGQSLFDGNPGDDGGGDDGSGTPPALECPEPCIANAAGDFAGEPTTASWRYVEDRRTRAWSAMTTADPGLAGEDPANAVKMCANLPDEPACTALPGALLVSSAGNTKAADPAIAYTSERAQVAVLAVSVHVPAGAATQQVRLYRNSREDALFAADAEPGKTLGRMVTVDALPGDRFYLALVPAAAGAANVGVHFFVTDAQSAFPTKCQLALSFAAATGNAVDNLCGADVDSYLYNDTGADSMVPPVLVPGPFNELGSSADLAAGYFYTANTVLVKSTDTTTQLWVKVDAIDSIYAGWPLSDMDLNNDTPGGLGIGIFEGGQGPQWVASNCTSGNPLTFAEQNSPYPNDGAWHFIRVVHTSGTVKMCLDGRLVASFALPAGKLVSTLAPRIGKNAVWNPAGAFFDGKVDDVRVISDALPCE